MDILHLLFVGLASFVVGSHGVCYPSVDETAKICLTRSITFSVNSEDLLKTDITNLSRTQMNELCKIFHNFEECVEEGLNSCVNDKIELKKILETFEHSFNYICHDGFELLMKIKPCISTQAFKRHMSQCSYDATYKFNKLKLKLMTDYMMKVKACRYLEESIECAENTALRLCGVEAQKYFRELNIQAMAPAKEFLRCYHTRDVTLIGLGISIALLLALFVLVIGRYLRKRQIAQEISSETLLITGIHTPRMPTQAGVVGATSASHSLPLNEPAADNAPPQYPGTEPYTDPYVHDKNDYTAPPPSYEQVMAETRNEPKPL